MIVFYRTEWRVLTSLACLALNIALMPGNVAAAEFHQNSPPPIAIDACAAHPWYLPFQHEQHDALMPIAETRLSELGKRWQQDHGPVLIDSHGPVSPLTSEQSNFIRHRLQALGVSEQDIWVRASVTSPDPALAGVVEVTLPREGTNCRTKLRSARVAWLLAHCDGQHDKACKAQIEALEVE